MCFESFSPQDIEIYEDILIPSLANKKYTASTMNSRPVKTDEKC